MGSHPLSAPDGPDGALLYIMASGLPPHCIAQG